MISARFRACESRIGRKRSPPRRRTARGRTSEPDQRTAQRHSSRRFCPAERKKHGGVVVRADVFEWLRQKAGLDEESAESRILVEIAALPEMPKRAAA